MATEGSTRVVGMALVFNVLVVMAFAGAWFYNDWIASMGAPWRITDLDRAGVIDEEKLRSFDPHLAEDLRHNVGMWVAERERSAGRGTAMLGVAAGAINVGVALGLWVRRRRRGRPGKAEEVAGV